MKSISEYSKDKTGLDVKSLKALDAVSEWMEYKDWSAEDGVLYLYEAKAKKDIPLSAKRTIKEGTEFDKVGLTQAKQVLLYRKDEDRPYRRIMKHPINEDAFPVVYSPLSGYPAGPVIWNDGRIDGPFQPYNDVNGVLQDAIVTVSNLKERLGRLTVEQAAALVRGLGATFEELVVKETLKAVFKELDYPSHFGLR